MKKILIAMLFTIIMISSSMAGTMKIVAVVNDEIITSYDFYNRMNMTLVNVKQERNQENFEKYAPMVMEELVFESLKTQTAEASGITISSSEIDQAIMTIAQRNGMNLDEFYKNMAMSGIETDTLRNQLKSNISWSKYISKRIAPQVNIPAEEVNEFVVRTASDGVKTITEEEAEYQLTMEKIEILQKRKLRDLKDSAFIEVKLN